jgi:hypothetical protein
MVATASLIACALAQNARLLHPARTDEFIVERAPNRALIATSRPENHHAIKYA